MSYFSIKEEEAKNHNCKPVQDSRSGELSGPGVERKQAFQSFDANLEFNMETNGIVHTQSQMVVIDYDGNDDDNKSDDGDGE